MEEAGPTMVSDCPACGEKTLEIKILQSEIPHFGEVIQQVIKCTNCGMKHSDIQLLSQNEPVHAEYQVVCLSDLNTRVIRSNTATITIPELGVKIEPGPASEASISNVEAIMQKVLEICDLAISGGPEDEEKSREVRNNIQKAIEGEYPFTLVIEDPMGNSAIIAEKVKKRVLNKEELKSLRYGASLLAQAEAEKDAKEKK